jgi:hypothetical protein
MQPPGGRNWQLIYHNCSANLLATMEQRALKSINSCLNINIYSYSDTSGGQSLNLYLNVAYFFNTSVN